MAKYACHWLRRVNGEPKADRGVFRSKPVTERDYARCKRDENTIEARIETSAGTVLKIFRRYEDGRETESLASRRKVTGPDGREKWVTRIWHD